MPPLKCMCKEFASKFCTIYTFKSENFKCMVTLCMNCGYLNLIMLFVYGDYMTYTIKVRYILLLLTISLK